MGTVTVSIAIYYPATFVQQTVDCQTLTLTESNTEKVSCVSTFATALTPDVSTGLQASVCGDIYDWGSDILPVYVDDFPEGHLRIWVLKRDGICGLYKVKWYL